MMTQVKTISPARRRLIAALEAHEPLDEVEAAHVRTVLDVVATSADCFSRDHFAPGHVTGSAFVASPDGCLLLIHHRRLGRWLQPGGHDAGEHDPLATALREAREETALPDLRPVSCAILDVDVHTIPPGRGEPSHLHLDVRYLLVTDRPGAIAADADEATGIGWFDLDAAVKMMAEAGANRVVARLRA